MDNFKRIQRLEGARDWDLFKIRIRALLSEKGYIDAIKPKKEFTKNTARETIDEYNDKRIEISAKASAIIRLNLGDGPLISTKNIEEDNAEELYNRLKALYEPKGFSSEFLIAKELFSTTLRGSGNNIERYLTKIRSLTEDLAARDKAIPTEIIAAYTLNNLTNEYDYIIAAINQSFRNKEEIDLDDLFNAIIDESRRIEAKEPSETALYTRDKAKKKPNNGPARCYKCDKLGHIAKHCKTAKKYIVKNNDRDEESAALTL
jgi:hypothetical protein